MSQAVRTRAVRWSVLTAESVSPSRCRLRLEPMAHDNAAGIGRRLQPRVAGRFVRVASAQYSSAVAEVYDWPAHSGGIHRLIPFGLVRLRRRQQAHVTADSLGARLLPLRATVASARIL